jgi:hypothetical protein
MELLQVTTSRWLSVAVALAFFATGCVKRSVEISVHDPGRVGVNGKGAGGLVPVLPADGLDRSAFLAELPTGERPMVYRQAQHTAVLWSPASPPIPIVDPLGILPAQKTDRGIVVREGWLYSSYELTPKRILAEGTRTDFSIPVVLTTPIANVVEAREVREPHRWPAYVFLPVGGTFTLIGGSFLAISHGADENRLIGVTYLVLGIPLIVYGLVNAVATTEYAPLGLAAGPGP